MTYTIAVETVEARPIAAVRRSVAIGAVGMAWRPALDLVWAFLRRHPGLQAHGHNVFVYHRPRQFGGLMDVEFGVEVTAPFEADGDVELSWTPAGPAASTLVLGPVTAIGDANAAIEGWCAAHGRALAGVSWEIYGDPGPDPAQLEVRVFYLLVEGDGEGEDGTT